MNYILIALEAANAASKTRGYVPQRQKFPLMPTFSSSSVGAGFFRRNAVTAVTKPSVQKPHIMPSVSHMAACTG